jgi:hypothetical protein
MGQRDSKELDKFLAAFPPDVRAKAHGIRDFVWKLYPQTNELIYDNYNALAFGWSPTDRVGHTFCNVAVGRSSYNVHLGFYWGAQIPDPKGVLLGEGKQYRYLLVGEVKELAKPYVKALMKAAYSNSLAKVKDPSQLAQGLTIVKSASGKKRAVGKSTLRKRG